MLKMRTSPSEEVEPAPGRQPANSEILEGMTFAEWAGEVRRLARERHAVILAHNYQLPWIQDVADYVGDSLALSRWAAATDAEAIVFCGVHFMAETAKILSPDKTVLIPDPQAGCSLADTITAEQLAQWKEEHPGAVVVAYVNTSAAVKALADYCCTSSNAVGVVSSIPEDKEILFLPDMFLGQHVARQTGRRIHIWMGECHVHAAISPASLRRALRDTPEAQLYVHPECGCTTAALHLLDEGVLPPDRTAVLSTGGMVKAATSLKGGRVLVATETGILHQLKSANPDVEFLPVSKDAVCPYMKMITPAKLLQSLRDGVHQVTVPEEVRVKALAAVQRMMNLGVA
jgi:quinolinate synthase